MSRPHILCIEDDPDTAEVIAEILQSEDFKVTLANSGLAGLGVLHDKPDIVLCDIDLPDVSGFEVLARIREGKLLPGGVPFIFLTAFSQRVHQIRARQLGCDDYVTKPIDFELLVAIIRNRLASAAERAAGKSDLTDPDLGKPDFKLTERELQTLTWAARGKSSGDVAVILGISERTVNFHLDNAMRKVGVATRVQAAVKCAMLGIIKP
jgi:DNA-binding NarL/FixJ family response regulator